MQNSRVDVHVQIQDRIVEEAPTSTSAEQVRQEDRDKNTGRCTQLLRALNTEINYYSTMIEQVNSQITVDQIYDDFN